MPEDSKPPLPTGNDEQDAQPVRHPPDAPLAATYVLDRFEDNLAVLADEAGRSFNVPRFWLPRGLSEGDVVVVELQEIVSEDDLDFATHYRGLDLYVDQEATDARRDRARDLRERLPKAPAGDLEL